MIRPILLWWILASIAEAQIAYQTHYMPFTRSTGPVWMNMVDYSVSDSTGLVADPTSKIYVDARAWGLRLNAVRAESPVQLTPTAFPFASNKGFLARFVMTTVPAVSGSGPRSLFSLIAPGLYLNTPDLWVTLGHDNQAWSISRNANVSVNNGNILNQSRKFWQTPWDPLYDTIPTRQLLYWRLDPVGNAKIDRFVIYVDSEGTTRVQWDQGIQLAAIPLVSLTVGTPTSNPIKPDYYYWDDMYLAGQPNDSPAMDWIHEIRYAQGTFTDKQLIQDVVAYQSLLARYFPENKISFPCNSGQWLNLQALGSLEPKSFSTPCGDSVSYLDGIVGDKWHYGPPAGLFGYKEADVTFPSYAPEEVTQLTLSIQGKDKDAISADWSSRASATGYNIVAFDITDPNAPTTVLASWTNSTSAYKHYRRGRKYRFSVAAANQYGLGPTRSAEITLP